MRKLHVVGVDGQYTLDVPRQWQRLGLHPTLRAVLREVLGFTVTNKTHMWVATISKGQGHLQAYNTLADMARRAIGYYDLSTCMSYG